MLAKANINIEQFFPVFAETRVPVAFLVPTETGYYKAIMDATGPVRELLKSAGVHDYSLQAQGQDAKRFVRSFFVHSDHLEETSASLYRPTTKKGDPRIWFSRLQQYCNPWDLLSLIVSNGDIYVTNLSNAAVRTSLSGHSYVYNIIAGASSKDSAVVEELRSKIADIHNRGFIPSITPGDPGVGDTLENALGISRNNSKMPDYKGIELKTTRLTRNGKKRSSSDFSLFGRVPDEGKTFRQITETYGKIQTPRNSDRPRFQLVDTVSTQRVNGYGLKLEIDSSDDKLILNHIDSCGNKHFVSSWRLKSLREALLSKHQETFWVKAVSETKNGIEYFRYDIIQHTKNPNASLFAPLIETGIITVDLTSHIEENGKWRNHGVLFKMSPKDLHLLFGEPITYDLTL